MDLIQLDFSTFISRLKKLLNPNLNKFLHLITKETFNDLTDTRRIVTGLKDNLYSESTKKLREDNGINGDFCRTKLEDLRYNYFIFIYFLLDCCLILRHMRVNVLGEWWRIMWRG